MRYHTVIREYCPYNFCIFGSEIFRYGLIYQCFSECSVDTGNECIFRYLQIRSIIFNIFTRSSISLLIFVHLLLYELGKN